MALSITKGTVAHGKGEGRMKLVASSTWIKLSGYFFKISGSDAAMSLAASTTISGWISIGFNDDDANFTKSTGTLVVPSTTDSRYEFTVYGLGAEFYVPVASGQTLATTHAYKLVDLDVTSNKQTIDLGATSTQVVQVLPPTQEEIDANVARVRINPAKYGLGA